MDTGKVVGNIRMVLAYLKWGWDLLFHLSFFHHRHHNYSYNDEFNYQQPAHDQVQEYYHESNNVVSATAEDLRQSSECAVCLSKVEQGDEIRKLTCCHVFHKVCLDRWSMQSLTRRCPTCPLCRRSLISAPATSQGSSGRGPEVLLFDFASFVSSDHDTRDMWWLR